MNNDKMLAGTISALSAVDVGGKRKDPELAALDRGILEVALMVAGLDGTIEPSEYSAFVALAGKCRGATSRNVRALYDSAIGKAGTIAAMARSGVYSESDRLAAFVRMAHEALPKGFANGSETDLRRAFALWIAMGVSDGAFSGLENAAVHALVRRFAITRAATAKKFAVLLEPDFFAKAEKLCRDTAVASRRAKAEAALVALVAAVRPKTAEVVRSRKRARGKLACAVPGPTITGWR